MCPDQVQINRQAGNPLKCFRSVSVPKEVLDAVQLLRNVDASFRPLLLKAFGLLLQNRQPHRDVKPIEQMLAERMKVLLYAPDVFAAVGHEYHLLVFLHPLRFHQFPQRVRQEVGGRLKTGLSNQRGFCHLTIENYSSPQYAAMRNLRSLRPCRDKS